MATLKEQFEQGLAYAQRYFMGDADVQRAAQRIAQRLRELRIPYAICGGLAVTAHRYVRVTQDVDVLLTREGLAKFKDHCLGLGWVERFAGSRGMRDVENRVDIDVVLTGDYPGDGKAKPVRFPDPADVAIDIDVGSVICLPKLIELKIASGMTAPHRPLDLHDVIQLIRVNGLPRDYSQQLDPYVRAKFDELWGYAQVRDDEH